MTNTMLRENDPIKNTTLEISCHWSAIPVLAPSKWAIRKMYQLFIQFINCLW
jgi:hypothetical protein